LNALLRIKHPSWGVRLRLCGDFPSLPGGEHDDDQLSGGVGTVRALGRGMCGVTAPEEADLWLRPASERPRVGNDIARRAG